MTNIGYSWQYQDADFNRVSATVLHIRAVIDQLLRRGRRVRVASYKHGLPAYTDDLDRWVHPRHNNGQSDAVTRPAIERAIRRVQSELNLPYFRYFESQRFADLCGRCFEDFELIYERFWLMGYGGLLAAKRLGIPIVYEMNGDIFEEYRELGIQLPKIQWAVLHHLTGWMFRQADHIVTVSESLRGRVLDRWDIDPGKVSAVSNGFREELYFNEEETFQPSMDAGNGQVQMIFVGSFKPWHGLELIVEAFKDCLKRAPQARLVLVGDGPTRSALEQRIEQEGMGGAVHLTGQIPHEQVTEFLFEADIALLNPRYSPAAAAGSPMKLFEYMAAGMPIIAPRLPNIQEVLTHNHNGWLISPSDVSDLSDAMVTMVKESSLRKTLGEQAKRSAAQQFTWSHTVDRLEEIFDRLLEEKRANAYRSQAVR